MKASTLLTVPMLIVPLIQRTTAVAISTGMISRDQPLFGLAGFVSSVIKKASALQISRDCRHNTN
jgi:hypothetical protein